MSFNSPAGYYLVGNEVFVHKLMALVRASELKVPLTWHYYDEVFENYNTSLITGSIDVRELYKQRALQLRETYDYLILNYSGGIDSWTILHTFLSNNIKLDQILVKWPMKAMDKGWYTPNDKDKTAYNSVSEWDLVLKHDLAWLAQTHPEIKIEIVDWLDNLSSEKMDDSIIESTNLHRFYLSNLIRVPKVSNIASSPELAGKRIASILGIDKPQIVEKENKCYFYFSDLQFLTQEPTTESMVTTEHFYWTPKMPELTIKQSYKIFTWYKSNSAFRTLIKAPSEQSKIKEWTLPVWYTNLEDKTSLTKMIIYPDWDFSRFQALKPVPMVTTLENSASPKDIWLEKHLPMYKLKQEWAYHWKSYAQAISPEYLMPGTNQPRSIHSRWFYLGNF